MKDIVCLYMGHKYVLIMSPGANKEADTPYSISLSLTLNNLSIVMETNEGKTLKFKATHTAECVRVSERVCM